LLTLFIYIISGSKTFAMSIIMFSISTLVQYTGAVVLLKQFYC